MAPSNKSKTTVKPSDNGITAKLKPCFTKDFITKLIFNPHYIGPTCFLLLIFELILNVYIIENVKYTEIDWIAYMQEVESFLNGTLDYKVIKGIIQFIFVIRLV